VAENERAAALKIMKNSQNYGLTLLKNRNTANRACYETRQVFNIGSVQGNVGNVTNSQVTVNDYSSVHTLLIDRKVPMDERHELERIMEELRAAPPKEKPSLIQRGKDWIVKNKEFLGASAEIVSEALGSGPQ